LQALSKRFYWNVSKVNGIKGKYFQYFLFEWQNTNQEFRSDLEVTVTLAKQVFTEGLKGLIDREKLRN